MRVCPSARPVPATRIGLRCSTIPPSPLRFVDSHDGTFSHVTFSVPSLHCASCLWLLEQLWRFDDGIGRSEADLMRRTVRVAFRPDRTTLRAVAERLASLGYEPVVDGERAAGRMPQARRDLYLKLGLAGFAVGNMMLFSIPRYANGAPLDSGVPAPVRWAQRAVRGPGAGLQRRRLLQGGVAVGADAGR